MLVGEKTFAVIREDTVGDDADLLRLRQPVGKGVRIGQIYRDPGPAEHEIELDGLDRPVPRIPGQVEVVALVVLPDIQ